MLQHFDNRDCNVLRPECVTSFLVARKHSLLSFKLYGAGISDDCLSRMSMVKNLQVLEIWYADLLASQGLAAFSELTNLQSLRLWLNSDALISRADLLLAFSKPSWSSLTRFSIKLLLSLVRNSLEKSWFDYCFWRKSYTCSLVLGRCQDKLLFAVKHTFILMCLKPVNPPSPKKINIFGAIIGSILDIISRWNCTNINSSLNPFFYCHDMKPVQAGLILNWIRSFPLF